MSGRRTEDQLHDVLTGVSCELTRMRSVLRRLPSPPHCKLCAAPFEGPGSALLRHFGFGRFAANPQPRLAAQAEAGELLVSIAAATATSLDPGRLSRRRMLVVRGRAEPIEVASLIQ